MNNIIQWLQKRMVSLTDTYLVGGAVRDLLMGRPTGDLDIAVRRNPAQHADALAKRLSAKIVPIGKTGKMIYRVVSKTHCIDIAPFQGPAIESDLTRRDFTINALAVSLESGELIDMVEGRRDLARKTISMTSSGVFREDPIRLLRAYRFAAELGFRIHPDTTRAIARYRGEIRKSASERIWDEMRKFLACPNAHGMLSEMGITGLLFVLFPELEPLRGCRQGRHHREDVFSHTLRTVLCLEQLLNGGPDSLPAWIRQRSRPDVLKLAALLHDAGKPMCKSESADGDVHFYGHERKSADIAVAVAKRLRLSKQQADQLVFWVRNHMRPRQLFGIHNRGESTRRPAARFFRKSETYFPGLILISIADVLSHRDPPTEAYLQFWRQMIEAYEKQYRPRTARPPLLNGNDLLKHFQLQPGPMFRRLLDAVEEARLAGEIQTREEAMAAARNWIEKEGKNTPP